MPDLRRRAAAALWLLTLTVPGVARADVAVTRPAIAGGPVLDLAEAGWRFLPGDDPQWSRPDWDDSGWQVLRSTRPAPGPDAPAWVGMGWYRIWLDVAPDATTPLALELSHWGASEVFLDGQWVGGFGEVSARREDERTRNPRWRAVLLPIASPGRHVVAVRYSAWPLAGDSAAARWRRALMPPGIGVRLTTAAAHVERRDRDHAQNVALLTSLAVAFTAFAVLHLLFFVLERTDRQNLAFGGYAVSLAGVLWWSVHRELVDHTMPVAAWMQLTVPVLVALLGLSLVAFVAASRHRPVPRVAIVLAALQAGLVLVVFVWPEARWVSPAGGVLQMALVMVAFAGALASRDDAVQGRPALIVSALAGSTPLVLTALDALGVSPAAASRVLVIQAGLAMVLVLASLGQARRFALTSRNLRAQLVRVQELSARERERDRAEAEARVERERERAERERQARELEEARQFQLSLLPARLPDLDGWEAVASMQTASEVGGDYFDVRRQKDGVATLVIGDATGHGLRAGTLVAATKGLFQAIGDHEDLGVALAVMSAAMKDLKLRGLFMTLTIVRVHPDGRLQLASAGMPSAVLLSSEAPPRTVGEPAPPLGAPIRYSYRTHELRLQAGDRLVLMTDGVPERLDGREEIFGYERVPELLATLLEHRGADYIGAIEAALDAWAGRPPADDATLLVIARI